LKEGNSQTETCFVSACTSRPIPSLRQHSTQVEHTDSSQCTTFTPPHIVGTRSTCSLRFEDLISLQRFQSVLCTTSQGICDLRHSREPPVGGRKSTLCAACRRSQAARRHQAVQEAVPSSHSPPQLHHRDGPRSGAECTRQDTERGVEYNHEITRANGGLGSPQVDH